MRAYPDVYLAHIEDRVSPTPDPNAPDFEAALALRLGLIQLAAAVGPSLAVPVAELILDQASSLVDPIGDDMEAAVTSGGMETAPFERAAALTALLRHATYVLSADAPPPTDAAGRLLDRALPLVRPVSGAISDQSPTGEAAYYSVHELIDILYGTYSVLVAAGDTSYAVKALDLTRDFDEPGGELRVFSPLYMVNQSYLDAIAEALPPATDVEPIAVCAAETRSGAVVGHFGARTPSSAVVYVPVGPDNRFVSSTGREIPQTPPEFFYDIGDQPVPSFVTVVYPEPGESITWHILGRSATVDANAPPCRVVYPDRFEDNEPAPRCGGRDASVYIMDGFVVGGPDAGQPYTGALRGTDGPDVIVGTAGPDSLVAFGGDDVACGLDGDDTINGGDGFDEADGGDGTDTCSAEVEFSCEGPGGPPAPGGPTCDGLPATVFVSPDGLVVGGPDDGLPYAGTLRGTDGDDVIVGTLGPDTLLALGGDDALCGRGDADVLDGGPGADVLFGDDESAVTDLPPGFPPGPGPGFPPPPSGLPDDPPGDFPPDDGSPGDGSDDQPPGDDTLRGGDGDDALDGGPGADDLDGGPGDDVLTGWTGDDALAGGSGTDDANGGDGTDLCDAETVTDCEGPLGTGAPTCDGLAATVYVAADGLVVGGESDGQAYAGVLRGTEGPDVMVGTEGPDQLAGFAGDDVLCGLGGDDLLQGNGDRDRLFGGPGDDVLAGGNGGDVIVGDGGTDEARGGRGNDACDAEAEDSCERDLDD